MLETVRLDVPVRRLRCWWFGCEQHPQDPSPPDSVSCMHCGGYVEYSHLVGDTRHSRFMESCARFSWRMLFPRKCVDCGHRYKCDETVDHLPF